MPVWEVVAVAGTGDATLAVVSCGAEESAMREGKKKKERRRERKGKMAPCRMAHTLSTFSPPLPERLEFPHRTGEHF